MEHQMECGQAAHHQLQLEQQEQVTGYECPYCAAVYSPEASDCDGTDIVCCAEIGHCTPYYGEL